MDTPTNDFAGAAAKAQAAAADMKKYAPAEIQQAANTYADIVNTVAQSIASGTIDSSSMAQAVSTALAGNGKDIATTALWVSKNCNI